jgi:hypothetical protein
MRGPWGPQTNIFHFAYVVLVAICLFQAIWDLNHLDFSGYDKIQPAVTHIKLIRGLFDPWKTHEGPLGTPGGPQTNICHFVCVVLVAIGLLQAIWDLNHLDFSDYNKI